MLYPLHRVPHKLYLLDIVMPSWDGAGLWSSTLSSQCMIYSLYKSLSFLGAPATIVRCSIPRATVGRKQCRWWHFMLKQDSSAAEDEWLLETRRIGLTIGDQWWTQDFNAYSVYSVHPRNDHPEWSWEFRFATMLFSSFVCRREAHFSLG